jgi:hypothetical protein
MHGGNEKVECHGIEGSSACHVCANKRKRQGKGATRRNDSRRAPSAGRGRGQKSMKARVNRVLLDSEARGALEISRLRLRNHFKKGVIPL